MALVMSVNPGFSGQAFIPGVLDSVRTIRAHMKPTQWLQMDGGIGPDQAKSVRDAGCNVIVAASAIFKHPREKRADVVKQLRG
jgi:ribulose-phosphate 3-epimerase